MIKVYDRLSLMSLLLPLSGTQAPLRLIFDEWSNRGGVLHVFDVADALAKVTPMVGPVTASTDTKTFLVVIDGGMPNTSSSISVS